MNPTVLVVEDDQRIAVPVSKHLEATGFRPVLASREDETEPALSSLAMATLAALVSAALLF